MTSKVFLGISKTKIGLQLLLGKALIQNAPHDKTIIVSGAFEDPLDVRSSSPNHDIQALSSDHVEADTNMVLSVIHSHVVLSRSQKSDRSDIRSDHEFFGEPDCRSDPIPDH